MKAIFLAILVPDPENSSPLNFLPTLAFLFALTWTQDVQQDCDLRKSAEGIEVYTCKTTDSKINSIRSNFSLNLPFSELSKALLDWPNFNQWQYKIRKTELLKTISKVELIYRAELIAPWPVSNRDLILHVKLSPGPNPNEYQFTIIGKPDFIPPREGFVRVPVSDGSWQIKVVGPERIDIQYSLMVDPGGAIPAWLLNLSLAEGPFETFKGLREYLED